MAGIGGIVGFAGPRPAARDVLAAMGRAMAEGGPDGEHVAEHEGAAMIVRALRLYDDVPQPLLSQGGLLVAWDGRIDNRDECIDRLTLDSAVPDAEIIAAAYRRSARYFLNDVVGEFAVAVWDTQRRELHLGRDPFAVRPLHYARAGDEFLWATTPRALLATGLFSREVNVPWLEAFLILTHWSDEGPYRDILPVPPGEIVTLTPARVERSRFWVLEEPRRVVLPSDEDYEELFRELFMTAVRSRMRARGMVGCHLSGGLDSSSIACVLDRLLREGGTATTDMFTLSHVFDRAKESDERPHMAIVEEQTARTAYHYLEDENLELTGFETTRTQVPSPHQLSPAQLPAEVRGMRQHGARLLFSGLCGDQLLWSQIPYPFHLAEHLHALRLRTLFRDLGAWARGTRHPYPVLLWQGVMRPFWQALRGRGAYDHDFGFAWLGDRVRKRIPELRRRGAHRGLRAGGFISACQRARQEAMRGGIAVLTTLIDEFDAGIVMTYPFLDRRLVEFALGVPFDQLQRPHEGRSLHRRALRDLLPHAIANRQDKRGPSQAIMLAIRREWPTIEALLASREARVYELGLVHRERCLAELERIRHGHLGDHAIIPRVLCLEVWLRSLDDTAPTQ